MDIGSIPVARAVGALLFSLGVKFDDMVKTGEELEL